MSSPTSYPAQLEESRRRAQHTLHAGDEILCERCQEWHRIWRHLRPHEQRCHSEGYLWFLCYGLTYYAGLDGAPSRHLARQTAG